MSYITDNRWYFNLAKSILPNLAEFNQGSRALIRDGFYPYNDAGCAAGCSVRGSTRLQRSIYTVLLGAGKAPGRKSSRQRSHAPRRSKILPADAGLAVLAPLDRNDFRDKSSGNLEA